MPRRTAARAAPSGSDSRRPPAPSSPSRTPTSSSIPRSWPISSQPILDGRTRVVYGSRFLAGRPDAPWLSIAANQVLTGAHQRAVRRTADRHGDLLQGDGRRHREVAQPRIEPVRHRARDHRQAAARRPLAFSSCRSASSRAAARRARRSAGETACARFRSCSNTDSRNDPPSPRLREGCVGLRRGRVPDRGAGGHRPRDVWRRERHVGGRRIRFVVLRVDGAGDGERRLAAGERACRRGAMARCVADAGARRLHSVTGSSRCLVADLRSRILGADGAAGRGVRAGCDLRAHSDLRAPCWCSRRS